jgi:hypothetical protein
VHSVNEYERTKHIAHRSVKVENTALFEPANVFEILTDPKKLSFKQGVTKFYDGWYLNST